MRPTSSSWSPPSSPPSPRSSPGRRRRSPQRWGGPPCSASPSDSCCSDVDGLLAVAVGLGLLAIIAIVIGIIFLRRLPTAHRRTFVIGLFVDARDEHSVGDDTKDDQTGDG